MNVEQADVLKWAAWYSGPKFHAMLCDPPYHLTDNKRAIGPSQFSKQAALDKVHGGGFMNMPWDGGDIAFQPSTWAALAEHLLPGAFGMAFASSRGWHRLAVAIEDAGLIIHPAIFGWAYGSGFPKATRIDTQIDKNNGRRFDDRYALGRHIKEQRERLGYSRAQVNEWFGYADGCEHWERQDPHGARVPTLADWRILRERLQLSDEWTLFVERIEAEREVIGHDGRGEIKDTIFFGDAEKARISGKAIGYGEWDLTAPATPLAQAWAGHRYGLQALKPALEPIIVFQKPYEGRPVECITETGAGALWIEGGRIEAIGPHGTRGRNKFDGFYDGDADGFLHGDISTHKSPENLAGRWPANFVLDAAAAERLDEMSGELGKSAGGNSNAGSGLFTFGQDDSRIGKSCGFGDSGGASRFFFRYVADALDEADPVYYCAKASRKERESGLDSIKHVRYNEVERSTDTWESTDQNQLTQPESGTQPRRDTTESQSGIQKQSQAEAFSITTGYGNNQTDPSSQDTKSITATGTNKTIDSKTLNSLTQPPISEYIADVSCEMGFGGNHASGVGNSSQSTPITGISQKKDGPNTGAVKSATLRRSSKTSRHDEEDARPVNSHPCIKPIALARYLATLLLPPAEYAPRRILVPFSGAGSEMVGAYQAGWEEITGIEMEQEYCEIARARLEYWQAQKPAQVQMELEL